VELGSWGAGQLRIPACNCCTWWPHATEARAQQQVPQKQVAQQPLLAQVKISFPTGACRKYYGIAPTVQVQSIQDCTLGTEGARLQAVL
jgi:predicted nucleic acid-binding Zn ribbon protein